MKGLLVLITTIFCLTACGKSDKCDPIKTQAPAAEITNLRSYLDSNHIAYTANPLGFFYHVDVAGTGSRPTACKTINIAYTGTFLNGVVFDQSADATFDLSGLIAGWQEALPLTSSGSTITLYLPPSLAYGASAAGTIPANSYLKFVIVLKGFS